ncbi:MAG: hypothetical protein ACK56F_19800, partial [bacterium]
MHLRRAEGTGTSVGGTVALHEPRAIAIGISHLRSRSFLGPPSAYASPISMLAAAKTYPRRIALVRMCLLAVSDAKASSVPRIRERANSKFNRFHPNRRDPAPNGVQFIQG